MRCTTRCFQSRREMLPVLVIELLLFMFHFAVRHYRIEINQKFPRWIFFTSFPHISSNMPGSYLISLLSSENTASFVLTENQ